MKKVQFDEKLEQLVDERGKKYGGKRFSSVSTVSNPKTTKKDAEDEALFIVETLAKSKGADAYEIVHSSTTPSPWEYDISPFTTHTIAFFYKNR